MPSLIAPAVVVHASFLRAMEEHRAEADPHSHASFLIGTFGDDWESPSGFAAFVAGLRAQELEETPRPPTFVPTTTLWWVDGTEYLGRVGIRHRLAPGRTSERNGHIGYDVRPSARRQGHASAMLAAALPAAARLGLPAVLITCDDDNVASRRTIENNGGVLHDHLDQKLRFWLPTG